MDEIIIHAPRDLRIEAVEPVPPAQGEVRVEIKAGGICGSDLHYYHHGGFGTVRIREPMALGHEIAGVVAEIGEGVEGVRPGDRVAVNPSLACGDCRYCQEGLHQHCLDMRFMGSAMRFPHVQGGFRQSVTVAAVQAVPVADRLSLAEAAAAEPLAVCLHAAAQAGPLLGKSVLVTGCGPIGALLVAVARHAGAAEIVATDVEDFPLWVARAMGADRAVNVTTDPGALAGYTADKGHFDVLFEASGRDTALRGALPALRPRASLVQVGLGGEMTLPMDAIVTKELRLAGTFRFDTEFALAVALMGKGLIDVKPLLTHTFAHPEATRAFETASDRSQAIKVQLSF